MRYINFKVAIAIFISTSAAGMAQSPMSLYHMETIPQVSQLNPAMQPRANWYVALPWVNQRLDSDLGLNTIFQESPQGRISPLHSAFNYGDIYDAIGQAANINVNVDAGIFGFGFRRGNSYFSLGLSIKSASQIGFPSDLLRIMEVGFPDGGQFDLAALRIKQMLYKEFSIGYSREWNEYLTFGANLKPIFGLAGGISDISTLQLNTSRSRFEMAANGEISVSGPLSIYESSTPGEFPDSIVIRDFNDDELTSYLTSFSNPGLAIDLGAVYNHGNNWVFSASLTNLGFISWERDVSTLSFEGNYDFDGVVLNRDNNHDFGNAAEAVLDSIADAVIFDTNRGGFITTLTPSLYLGASYDLTHYFKIGVVSRSIFQKQDFRQDFNVSANLNPFSFLAMNVNYAISTKGRNGMGAGLTWLMGPLQVYLLADYIPVRYSNVNFDGREFLMFPDQRDFSFKLGMNLVFGRHGYRDKPQWEGACDFR